MEVIDDIMLKRGRFTQEASQHGRDNELDVDGIITNLTIQSYLNKEHKG